MTIFIVAEEQDLVRAGIEALLKKSGHSVLGHDLCDDRLLEAKEIEQASVIILGQGVAGAEMHLPRKLKARKPSLRIILLLRTFNIASTFQLVRPEIDGVLLEDTSADRLLDCVNDVCAGNRWLDPHLLDSMVLPSTTPPGAGMLTARETSISDLVARGLRNKQIARELSISEPTVKMHLRHIYSKLQLSGRTELALMTQSNSRRNGSPKHDLHPKLPQVNKPAKEP